MHKLSLWKQGASEELRDRICDAIFERLIGYREAGVKKTGEQLMEELGEHEKHFKSHEAFKYHLRFCFWLTRSDRRLQDYHDFLCCEELRKKEKSYSEISKITGIPKSRIHRLLGDKYVVRWTVKDTSEWLGISSSAVREIRKEAQRKSVAVSEICEK